ncbi:hypothetical protein AZE42_03451 [Rhizopogon vesiculosus]|uniref:DUF6533 domain-containing protein n=1 Tax=Rhizopogon vesiculosus TaxID=180088 RepID=A0A1J8PHM9_9AGAM|nr:hypothetical protein AZE42_03451 [Rhizopogon vesiculosus]
MDAELTIIFDDIRILQMARMFQLSAAAVVIYDHAINLKVLCSQREVDLIWKRSKSLVSYLYFTNRYVGDFIVILSAILFISSSFSVEFTRLVHIHLLIIEFLASAFQAYGPFASVWATQLIMQLRIYAMYRKSKKILAFTATCFVMEIAAICTVLAINFDHSLTYTNEPIPGLLKIFELLLFVLAIFVAFKHMKNTHTVAGKRLHSTMATLVRYNTTYFFIEMLGCAVASGLYLGLPVMWFLTVLPSLLKLFIQAIYLEITNSVLIAVTIILGSRLVLSIRNFYADPSEEDTNLTQATPALSHTFQSFTQPTLVGHVQPFYDSRETEMSTLSTKGYRLNIDGDRIV